MVTVISMPPELVLIISSLSRVKSPVTAFETSLMNSRQLSRITGPEELPDMLCVCCFDAVGRSTREQLHSFCTMSIMNAIEIDMCMGGL